MSQGHPTTEDEFGLKLTELTGQALRDIHAQAARELPPETVLVGIVNTPERVNDPIDIGGDELYTSSRPMPEGWLATDTLIGLTPGMDSHYVTLSRPWHTEDLDEDGYLIHPSEIIPVGAAVHIDKDDLPRLFDRTARQEREEAQREEARERHEREERRRAISNVHSLSKWKADPDEAGRVVSSLMDELKQSTEDRPESEAVKQPLLTRIVNAPATPVNLALTMMAIVTLIGIVLAVVDAIF